MKNFCTAAFLTVICVMLFFCTAGFASADEWSVRSVEDNAGRIFLVVENNLIKASFVERHAWMLGEVFYKGREVVGIYGSNGSVLSVERDAAWERPQENWLGSGHGGEKVISYNIEADGEVFPYAGDIAVSGREVRLVKESEMGPFIYRQTVHFPPSGDYIVQEHRYRVFRDPTGFKFMYAFMHQNARGFDEWVFVLPDSERKEGMVEEGRTATITLSREILSVAFYDKNKKTGVAYAYPRAYAGRRRGNFVWARARDIKFYFQPDIAPNPEIGEEFEYKIKMIPFLADSGEWREKAFSIASF